MAAPVPAGFQFAIDRGGTFTDVFARCPGGRVRVLKLLSEDPSYGDAPTEGIRRVLQEVRRRARPGTPAAPAPGGGGTPPGSTGTPTGPSPWDPPGT